MVIERLSTWALRLVALLMLFGGLAAMVAGGLSFGLSAEIPVLKLIVAIIVKIAALFAIAGGIALFLSRSRGPLLPNERMTAASGERPALGGWLILLALALVALPIGLVFSLRGFIAGWTELTKLLDAAGVWDGMWQGANANMSGVILIPLAGALAPALLIWAAMGLFIVAAMILLASLAARSPGFVRAYLAWGILLAALVIACVLGADGVIAIGQSLQPLLEPQNGALDETAAVRDGIGRYAAIVGSAATVLVVALGCYLLWLPALLFSRRARTTFAPAAHSPDIESITRHPRSGR